MPEIHRGKNGRFHIIRTVLSKEPELPGCEFDTLKGSLLIPCVNLARYVVPEINANACGIHFKQAMGIDHCIPLKELLNGTWMA